MDDVCDSFRNLAVEPTFCDGTSGTLEYTLRDTVLRVLVLQVQVTDVWTWDEPPEAHPVTFDTLADLRGTCSSWREYVEGTAEWAALILARYEFSCLVPPLWNTESDFLECRFQLHRDLFSCTTWLPRPLDNNLRTLPLEHLHATDLEVLSAALAGGQQLARWERTGHLRSAPRLWISPDDRRGFL